MIKVVNPTVTAEAAVPPNSTTDEAAEARPQESRSGTFLAGSSLQGNERAEAGGLGEERAAPATLPAIAVNAAHGRGSTERPVGIQGQSRRRKEAIQTTTDCAKR